MVSHGCGCGSKPCAPAVSMNTCLLPSSSIINTFGRETRELGLAEASSGLLLGQFSGRRNHKIITVVSLAAVRVLLAVFFYSFYSTGSTWRPPSNLICARAIRNDLLLFLGIADGIQHHDFPLVAPLLVSGFAGSPVPLHAPADAYKVDVLL